jgi:hypothetical protein
MKMGLTEANVIVSQVGLFVLHAILKLQPDVIKKLA